MFELFEFPIFDEKTISTIVRHTVCPCHEHEIVIFLCNNTFSSKDKIWLFFQDIYLPWKGQFRFLVDETTIYHVFSRRLARATFPFIANSFVHGTSKPPRNIVEHFFFPVALHVIFLPCTMKYFARQMSRRRLATVIQSS